MIFEDIKKGINDGTLVDKASDTIGKTLDFLEEHKEGLLVASAAAITVSKLADMSSSRRYKQKVAQRSYSQWDPKHMHHWELRRPLTNRERIELDRRVAAGESMVNVLYSMRVLR